MRVFLKIAKLELSRNLNIGIILITLALSLFSTLLIKFGIDQYEQKIKKSTEFISAEKNLIERHFSIYHYGLSGFRIMSMSSPMISLFQSSVPISNLEVSIDSFVKLKINKQEKGANVFEDSQGRNLDFAWFFFVFGSGFVMIWAFFNSHKREKFFQYLLNLAGKKTIFYAGIFADFLFILFFLIFNFCSSIILFHIKTIPLNYSLFSGLLTFYLVSLLFFLMFLCIGRIIANSKSNFKAGVVMFITWFCLTIFIPKVFNIFFSRLSNSLIKSIHHLELQKATILSQFDEYSLTKMKAAKTKDEIKKVNQELAEVLLNKYIRDITRLENDMLEDIKKTAKKNHFFSIFTPCTFYRSVNNELSSFGFNGFIDVYKKSIVMYEGFVKYFIENRMSGKKPKDIPFIAKPDDYIVQLKSSLPDYFWGGVLFNLFALFVLTWVSYYRFKRAVFPVTKNTGGYKKVSLKIISGKHFIYACNENDWDFPAQIYNALSGMRKYPGTISIDGNDLVPGDKQDFFYIPRPDMIPEKLRISALIDLFTCGFGVSRTDKEALKKEFSDIIKKPFGKLGKGDKIEVLSKLAALKKHEIYLLNDLYYLYKYSEKDEIPKKSLDIIKDNNTTIIEVNAITSSKHSRFDICTGFFFNENSEYRERIITDKL